MELWEPVVDKFPEVTLKEMLKLLMQVKRISLDQLKDIGKEEFSLERKQDHNKLVSIIRYPDGYYCYSNSSMEANGILVSMQKLKKRMPCNVLYANRLNQGEEETRLNLTEELEAEPTHIKEKPNLLLRREER